MLGKFNRYVSKPLRLETDMPNTEASATTKVQEQTTSLLRRRNHARDVLPME
jgi:hypothetical protein